VQYSSISLAATHTECRKLCFLAKRHLRNETLTFADALGKFQNNPACRLKRAAPS